MSVCNWRYSPLREWGPPNTVQPSLPLRGWGLARMAQFHCPYYRPPLVDEAPPTEVGAVAGGGCAARELVGGSQPYGIFFHLGLPSAAEFLLRRACPGPREDIAPHLCWSGRNGDSVTRSRPTCSKLSQANKISVLPIHMDFFPCGCAATRARLVPLEPVRLR